MAQETELPMMAAPTAKPPPPPEDTVATVRSQYFNRNEAKAWLKSEEARAHSKSLDGKAGHDMQGCRIQEEACMKLHRRIAGWKKTDEEAALAQPIDLEEELGKIKEPLLPAPPEAEG